MTRNARVTGTAKGMPAGIGTGVAVSMLITLAGAAVLTWLIASQRLAETATGYGSMIILLLASCAGNLISCAQIKRRRLMVCAIGSGCYYTALFVVALLFGGQFEGMGITALFVILGGGIAAVLGLVGN